MWTIGQQAQGLRDVDQGRGFVDNVDMWTIDFKSVNPLWGAG
jgi:hypothetical protein